MEVIRVVVVVACNDVDAGVELGGETRRQLVARRQGDAPAVGMREPRRVEDRIRSGDRRRLRGLDEAVGLRSVRPAQDPELGEPGEVAELPRGQVDARLLRHVPGVVVLVHRACERRRTRVAHRLGEGRTGETARVSDHRALRAVP